LFGGRQSGNATNGVSFGDNSVNISLPVSTTIMSDRIFMEVFRVFHEKKIEMPYPQQDVHVRSIECAVGGGEPAGKNNSNGRCWRNAA
jgi:hypothetical protein